jgi:hypothetical protein
LYLNKDAHLEFADTDFISSYKQAGLDEKRATLVLTLLIEKGVFFIRKEINDQLKCLSRFFENPSVIIQTDQDTVEAYAEVEKCKRIGVGSNFKDDCTYNRSSTRRFSGEKLPIDELSAILETTYFKSNLGHRPVPSGGAFYPLQFFYLQNKKECLLHHFPSSTPSLTSKVGLCITDYVLSDDQIDWEQSDGLLFIFADLQFSSKKYGYKSLRLAYLEAGHCAQNIYLMAEKDKKLGVCEIA